MMWAAGAWIAGKAGGLWRGICGVFSDPARFFALVAQLAILVAIWEYRSAAKWERSYNDLVAATQSASQQAAKDQAAVNHHPAAISAAIAEQSNAQAPAYYSHALDVADLHRVRPAPASSARRADLPGADHAAPVDDRPAAPADLVCRPKADDDLLVGAAARAAQMQADAKTLIASGAARASTLNEGN